MNDNWLPGVHLGQLTNGPRLTPGIRGLKVSLHQNVQDKAGRNHPGPHSVGRCNVLADGLLAISLLNTEAGRTARALLADDVVDIFRQGERPTIRLR